MRKGDKRKGASKAGRKDAVAESHNDEVIAESLEDSTQEESQLPKEDVAEENGKEDAERNQENGVKDEEEDKQVDEAKDASSAQQKEDVKAEEEDKKEKPAARGGGKRKRATTKKEIDVKDEKKPAPRAKKARVIKPQEEPEYFEDERNLEGLWKAAFPVGTEWDQLDALYEFNWDFKHLEEALEEEDGLLYGKKVFLFGCTEPQLVPFKGANKILHVPAVVAVESPFPPSDKIGITSVQREVEEIIPMKTMKMDWLPYIPVDKRGRQVDRMDFQIFVLGCTRRRAALRRMKEDLVKKYEYCLPYFYQPFTEDELEQSTEVQIMFPSEPPVVCEFDWELDELEEFVDKLIEDEALAAEQKDEFKEYVKEQVRAAKKANREAREARRKAIEEMSEETKQAFQSMKFYKFYPLPSPETPDVSGVKSRFINRYYGKAHEVL
ncbi:unnamed protein product [Eruca vesicaria subsp. sativa]|uniref:Protein HEAT INTOLERANT 4-like n=1 Tax=Eruca vesicaria subsp. sativa TaxID=29727 RepID=A0ABC8KEM1_ERUVS|nr:unnamed protein product [Eruca vesicaria subsp. sativa]